MLQSGDKLVFQKDLSIQSENSVVGEINYNKFIKRTYSGVYDNPITRTTFSAGTGYDSGTNITYFNLLKKQTLGTYASSNTFTVADADGIEVNQIVEAKYFSPGTRVTNISSTTITVSSNIIDTDNDFDNKVVKFVEYSTVQKQDYMPLSSIFSSNRPDPGIVYFNCNMLHQRIYAKNTDTSPFNLELQLGNFGNVRDTNSEGRKDRFYPIYKNSTFRYWSSIRKKIENYFPKTVGVSDSSGDILNASPFVVYEESFWANKIVVKTQKYLSYPTAFKIEYLPHGSNTWTEAFEGDGTENPDYFIDGKLEIYYNGSTWSTTKNIAEEFTANESVQPTDSVKIRGLRFAVLTMSEEYTPVEVIELSPRLEFDLTAYTMSFDKTASISRSDYGLYVTGISSATGSLRISNADRIFSDRNTESILSGKLVEGTQISFYQVVNSVKYPIAVMYAVDWSEDTDFTMSVTLSDYFYFLDRTKSPDLLIANINGIPVSTAILLLLDNAGITNYEFIKSDNQNDDFVMDWMYANNSNTVSEVLQNIATSAQYVMFFDANNILKIITKEKLSEIVSGANTDYWLVGSEDWEGKDEEDFLTSSSVKQYVSNLQSISISSSNPITEATIEYKGIDVKRQPTKVLKNPELFNDENNPFYNLSVVSRDISYVNSAIWGLSSLENTSDATLLAVVYINNIAGETEFSASNNIPEILNNTIATPISATSEQNAIRSIMDNASDAEKAFFTIYLDEERATEFYKANKFSGNVLIDSELIKYKGLIVDIFDISDPEKSKTDYVIFSQSEKSYIESEISSGSDVICKGLVVDLNFQQKNTSASLLDGNYLYSYVSNGRGYNNTNIASHLSGLESELLKDENKFAIKLYDTEAESKFEATGTMKYQSQFLRDSRVPELGNTYSYPGYAKISGPKSLSDKNKKVSKNADSYLSATSVVIKITGQGENTKVTAKIKIPSLPNTGYKKGKKVFLEGFGTGAVSDVSGLKTIIGRSKSTDSVKYIEVSLNSGETGEHSTPNGKVRVNTKFLPIDNKGEQYITGFYKELDFTPNRISTRMRLLAKPDKYYFSTEDKEPKYEFKNRGIAGIAFNIKKTAAGVIQSGYFLEIEEIGNITSDQLTNEDYENMRLYYVSPDNTGNLQAEVIGKAWVNVSAVAEETADLGQALVDTHSYAGTSDVTIILDSSSDETGNIIDKFNVYWESNLVFSVDAINAIEETNSSSVGLFVRGNSEALFEYLLATSIPTDASISVSSAFTKGTEYMSISGASDRGILPKEVVVDGQKIKSYMEDFGKMAREAIKFDVRFESPAVSAYIISIDKINPDYYVADFSASSYGASFWVYNTSRFSLGLGEDKQTPIIISGVKLEDVNPGRVTLNEYAKLKFGSLTTQNEIDLNIEKYGKSNISVSSEYINNKGQAEELLDWIVEHSMKPKNIINSDIFANPLLELGDKIRLYYSDMEYEIAKTGDKVYFISSITYKVDENGISMNVEAREI